ncbi:MAG: ATP-binding cassette domain-containing protein, partial [Rhodospirillales bacterium]
MRIKEVLDRVNMSSQANEFPHTLSGGQQQRVALARALAPKPSVILLDEPFSGLDQNMRIQIREETLGILKSSGVATLMVTHNPEEALFMA